MLAPDAPSSQTQALPAFQVTLLFTASVPIELPGAIRPSTVVAPPIVPEPARVAPAFTVVVELPIEPTPPTPTIRVPCETVVGPV